MTVGRAAALLVTFIGALVLGIVIGAHNPDKFGTRTSEPTVSTEPQPAQPVAGAYASEEEGFGCSDGEARRGSRKHGGQLARPGRHAGVAEAAEARAEQGHGSGQGRGRLP